MPPDRRRSLYRTLGPSAAAAVLFLSACQVGPNFQAPSPSQAAGYAQGGLPTAIAPDQRLVAGGDVPARWWEAYGSPELNALMDQAITYARKDGQERLLVGVYVGNARAQTFYQRNGFEKIGERTFSVGPRQYEDYVYALSL